MRSNAGGAADVSPRLGQMTLPGLFGSKRPQGRASGEGRQRSCREHAPHLVSTAPHLVHTALESVEPAPYLHKSEVEARPKTVETAPSLVECVKSVAKEASRFVDSASNTVDLDPSVVDTTNVAKVEAKPTWAQDPAISVDIKFQPIWVEIAPPLAAPTQVLGQALWHRGRFSPERPKEQFKSSHGFRGVTRIV